MLKACFRNQILYYMILNYICIVKYSFKYIQQSYNIILKLKKQMRMISTIAILIGSANISLISATYYNYNQVVPLTFFLLSFAYIALVLLIQYTYRRFKLIQPKSIFENVTLFRRYLYLFAIGTVFSVVKWINFLIKSDHKLEFQQYIFIQLKDTQHQVYLNMFYYTSNYILGLLYMSLFKRLYNEYKNKITDGINMIIADQSIRCSICWEDIRIGNKIIETKCKHYFHNSCLRKWLYVKNSCPNCVQRVNETFAENL